MFDVKDIKITAEVEAETKLKNKINEANTYLLETEWAETYKTRHDLGLELIPEESTKWEKLALREEYKTFLRTL